MTRAWRSEPNLEVSPAIEGEFQPLRLGIHEIWPPVVLAPMAGITNAPFRTLCRNFGAGLYVSEMISARGFIEQNQKTHRLAQFASDESPRSLQLYGTDPKSLNDAARALAGESRVDHIDLNFGCPVRKVTRNGGGAAIPLKPRLMARLVRAVVEGAGEIPVTVKVRMGIDENHLSYLDAGRVARDEGARWIGLHARTAAQLYSGQARWEAIATLKEAMGSFPVLGNGDIWEAWDALRMMRATGCDGVIIGRGCLGRPWLFKDLAAVFDGIEPDPSPDLGCVREILLRHAHELVAFFGEDFGIRHMRKWCGWYLKGFSGTATLRGELARVSSLQTLIDALAPLDSAVPYPTSVIRTSRAKGGGTQKPSLPEGYLDRRDDDDLPVELDWDSEESLSGG